MGDGVARTWDLASGKIIREFVGHTGFLHAVVTLGASGEIATGSEDGTVRLWDVRSAGCVDVVHPSSSGGSSGSGTASAAATSASWVAALAVDPDRGSNWLACAGGVGEGKGFVSWLHVPTRRAIASQPCATPINALCLQPEERTLLAVGHTPAIAKYRVPQMSELGSQPIAAAAAPLYGVAATRSAGARLNSGAVAVCGRSDRVDVFMRGRAFALQSQ